ncbi:hypothetical protein PoB_005797500 [Plakobranchus ocellatus]|uniref:Uncharacterized protein n=1 Tax=Plakobranchus ocellatus TaxID=259542 RepID=A0AAV4CIQ0_9GAST|nr:hypothetical protein PoB_005797500 [Plakobranchus ocellatus]
MARKPALACLSPSVVPPLECCDLKKRKCANQPFFYQMEHPPWYECPPVCPIFRKPLVRRKEYDYELTYDFQNDYVPVRLQERVMPIMAFWFYCDHVPDIPPKPKERVELEYSNVQINKCPSPRFRHNLDPAQMFMTYTVIIVLNMSICSPLTLVVCDNTVAHQTRQQQHSFSDGGSRDVVMIVMMVVVAVVIIVGGGGGEGAAAPPVALTSANTSSPDHGLLSPRVSAPHRWSVNPVVLDLGEILRPGNFSTQIAYEQTCTRRCLSCTRLIFAASSD